MRLKKTTAMQEVVEHYARLYYEKFGLMPEIRWSVVGYLVKSSLKNHSEKGIKRIIDLYFEDKYNHSFHLPMILSSYSFNKYLPKMKFNPLIYADAEELNKDLR